MLELLSLEADRDRHRGSINRTVDLANASWKIKPEEIEEPGEWWSRWHVIAAML
jgi:hypothetical protein